MSAKECDQNKNKFKTLNQLKGFSNKLKRTWNKYIKHIHTVFKFRNSKKALQ